MKTKLIFIAVTVFTTLGIYAQTSLNEYKYVIVSNKFDFQKTENSYRLNELSQFLFNKYGFTALMAGTDYPEDLSINRCLALRSDVLKESGMFITKLKIILKNCNDQIVYTSKVGESREKEYYVAYNKALRSAFTSLQTLNYSYAPSENSVAKSQTVQVETKNKTTQEIEKLKAEIQNLKKEKELSGIEASTVVSKKVVKDSIEDVTSKIRSKTVTEIAKTTSNILYAQAIENGFQLVDSTPKVVFKMKNTGLEDVFLVDGKNAIIYKKGEEWILEHYQGSNLLKEKLKIKF